MNVLSSKTFCTAALFVFMATAVASGASMVIDSLSGPVTQNEINSFITFMQSQTPPPTPWGALNGTGHNDWADGTGGRELEAMGEMFEVSDNMTILNQILTNSFDSNGAFEFTCPLNSDGAKQFFQLQVQ